MTTKENLNGRISCEINRLKPGVTYYYRTFFSWNGKYFYSPEVKSFKAKGADDKIYKITIDKNGNELSKELAAEE